MTERTDMITTRFTTLLTDELECHFRILSRSEWDGATLHPTERYGWKWPTRHGDDNAMVEYSPDRIAETIADLDNYDAESYLLMVEYAISRHVVLLMLEDMSLDDRVRKIEDELGDTWDHCLSLLNAVQAGTNGENG